MKNDLVFYYQELPLPVDTEYDVKIVPCILGLHLEIPDGRAHLVLC